MAAFICNHPLKYTIWRYVYIRFSIYHDIDGLLNSSVIYAYMRHSFNSHGLCEIPWFIDIETLCNAHIVSEELERYDGDASRKVWVGFRYIHGEIRSILDIIVPVMR